MVFAFAHFALPSGVFGPVEVPPCVLHTRLPRIAALRHCSALRLERAWHFGVCTVPKTFVWDKYSVISATMVARLSIGTHQCGPHVRRSPDQHRRLLCGQSDHISKPSEWLVRAGRRHSLRVQNFTTKSRKRTLVSAAYPCDSCDLKSDKAAYV